MPTTALNGWTYPASSEFVANGATAMGVIANAIDTSSQLMYTRICTSTTRPTNLDGRIIAETDTDRVLYGDGVGWTILAEPTQTWTPAVANLTVGNGVWTAAYKRGDGWLDFRGHFVLGTTSAVAGAMTLTLPIAAVTANTRAYAQGYFGAALSSNPIIFSVASTTTVQLLASNSAGTYVTFTATSASVPIVWASTNTISFDGRYQMTTRYS